MTKVKSDAAFHVVVAKSEGHFDGIVGEDVSTDVTDMSGRFDLRISTFEPLQPGDSLRIGGVLKDGSVYLDAPFAATDTARTTPVYVTTSSESGCSCSVGEERHDVGHTNHYADRMVRVR